MNYQASNPESLSETPERLSETKMRSGSPAAAAAKKRAAEVLTSCTNLSSYRLHDCSVVKLFNLRGHLQEVTYFPGAATVLPITRPFTNNYQNFVLVKGLIICKHIENTISQVGCNATHIRC